MFERISFRFFEKISMDENKSQEGKISQSDFNAFKAAERTFLAWIRT